jgi:hypothetical protein
VISTTYGRGIAERRLAFSIAGRRLRGGPAFELVEQRRGSVEAVALICDSPRPGAQPGNRLAWEFSCPPTPASFSDRIERFFLLACSRATAS